MTEQRLRAVLVGAGGFGADLLRALCESPRLAVTGVSDRDPAAAEDAAAQAGCGAYADKRQLLAETDPQAVFVALPPAPAADVVALAGRRGAAVWRTAPVGRNLPEAVALCRAGTPTGPDRPTPQFTVGTGRRFMGGYRHAKGLLPDLGEVYLAQAQYLFNWGGDLGWRGDRAAGGGAMMELGYPMVDLLIWLLGLPESVACSAGRQHRGAGGPDRPVYDSDDTAVAVLRYRGQATATVTVSRCFNPISEHLTVYADGGSIVAGPNACTLRDRDGVAIDRFSEDAPPAEVFARQVEAFASAVAGGAARYACSGWENLLTLAAIDAAYLSDQTGQAESPGVLLANEDLRPADCLRATPIEGPTP